MERDTPHFLLSSGSATLPTGITDRILKVNYGFGEITALMMVHTPESPLIAQARSGCTVQRVGKVTSTIKSKFYDHDRVP